jgi:anti-sigma B factor antagonist
MYPSFERYQAAVVAVDGNFFGSTHGPTLVATLDDLLARGRSQIVIDLSDATLMDSTGIGVLIGQAERLRELGGDLRLAGVRKKLRNLFIMTRLLGEVFVLYDTVDEAVESFTAEALAA